MNTAAGWLSSCLRERYILTMITTKLDLTGLKCPLPALKTRKALKSVKPGDRLEVHCTDPLSVIDIPHLIAETGDRVEITTLVGRNSDAHVYSPSPSDAPPGLAPSPPAGPAPPAAACCSVPWACWAA